MIKLIFSLLAVTITLIGCASQHQPIIEARTPVWTREMIQDIITNDNRVEVKNIASIVEIEPLKLRVTTGNIGFLSGYGQQLILQFDKKEDKWVICEVYFIEG